MPPYFASLPESVWAEINRRLRIEPALWQLTGDRRLVDAFVEHGEDLTRWRPGRLGLRALSVLEPDSAQEPIAWLNSVGRKHLAAAYEGLVARGSADGSRDGPQARGQSMPELVEATIAAVALRQRLLATGDAAALVTRAAADRNRWALPLLCLYGLLDDPRALVVALLAHRSDAMAELAARIWLANESPQDLAEQVPAALQDAPVRQRLVVGEYFMAQGLTELARTAAGVTPAAPIEVPNAGPAAPPPRVLPDLFRRLASGVEGVLLAELRGDRTAQLSLGRAVQSAQTLTAELALHLGQFALAQGDPVSALAAYQEAHALHPDDQPIEPLVAEAKLVCGQAPAGADEPGLTSAARRRPRSQLALARVHRSGGDPALAKSAAVEVARSESRDAQALAEAADMLTEVGDYTEAAQALRRLLSLRPADAGAHLACARHALATDDVEGALESAWQAVGLAPCDSACRRALAEILALGGDLKEALAQWRRTAELDPAPEVQVRLSEAALAAAEPELALAVAEGLLDGDGEVTSTGLAHVLAGKALSALGRVDEAFDYFNQATALAPESADSWRAVAAYHRDRGDRQSAIAALEAGCRSVAEGSSEAADLYGDLGAIHADLGQSREAIGKLEKAARIQPNRPDFFRRLGQLYANQGELPSAITALRHAADLSASDPQLWHDLGRTLEAAGDFADALGAYEHARSVAASRASRELFRDLGRLAYQLGQPALARPALEMAIQNRAPEADDVETLALLGAIYEQAGEYEEAMTTYRKAIALAPNRSDMCVRLGVCCLELGQAEAAIAVLKEPAELDLEDLALQRTLGRAYAAAHLWVEAELAYEQAARLAPDDHGLLQALAHVCERSGNFTRAVSALQQAMELAPRCAEYRQALAGMFLSQNRLGEARATYLEALALEPGSAAILMGLGQVHMMLEEISDAVRAFERAAAVNPESAEIQYAVGESNMRRGSHEAAHAAFLRAAELEPNNPLHPRGAGECLWQLERHAAAIALWQKAVVAHPHDSATHARLGTAYMEQGRYSDAAAAFERATAVTPDDPSLALEAARALVRLPELDRALGHLERAARLAPGRADVWEQLGQVCQASGAPDRALDAFRRASRLAPNRGRPQAGIAEVLAGAGRLAEAAVAAEAALAASPTDLDVLSTTSRVLLKAGRTSEAVEALTRVAEGRPGDPQAQFDLARALILHTEGRGQTSPDEGLDLLQQSLERAAALGADPEAVREWTGRSRAVLGDPAEAIPLLEEAASRRPSSDVYRTLASCYRRTGRLPMARQAIQAALDRTPDAIPNLLELARISLAQGEKAEARNALQRVVAAEPGHALGHQLLAEALLAMGQRDDAIAAYMRAIAIDPGQAAWHHKLAELYEGRREPDAALPHYQRAAALAVEQDLPAADTAAYLAALARSYARDQAYEAAAEQFESALALRGDVPAWWEQCGEVDLKLGQFERALECFSRAADLAPAGTAAMMGAARALLALGRAAEAEEKVVSLLRFSPDNPAALVAMAEIYADRGDLANAVAAYARAAECAPDTAAAAPAQMSQAALLRAAGQPMGAVGVLARVWKNDPDNDEALGLLGDALSDAALNEEALEAYHQAVKVAPRRAVHHLRLGRLCRSLGRLDAALAHLQRAKELDAANTDVLRETGLVFEGRRQFDRALGIYHQLTAAEPDRAENFFRAGIALKALRDYAEAAQMFQVAARLDPTDVEAERQRLAVSALGILSGKNA